MYVLALPVSGGGFGMQLGILQHLCESNIIPNVVLASSGGNVAAYIAAAADWKWAAVERIAIELTPSLFIQPWTGLEVVSSVVGFFKGDIYNRGRGINDFLKEHFTPESITKYEIWTGTYNKKRQRTRLFCNLKENNSIMDISCIDYELTQSMVPFFCEGELDAIGAAALASASIPGTVPPQYIDKEYYMDGGVSAASPLTIMQEPILKYVKDNNTSLHIIYVNSVDLSHPPSTNNINNVVDTLKQAANDLVRSQTVIDRLSGYQIIRCFSGEMCTDEFPCTPENMKRIKVIQSKTKYSLLEIYPTIANYINITTFKSADLTNSIRQTYHHCNCRLWWIKPDAPCTTEICNIIQVCKEFEFSKSDPSSK